MRSAFVLDASVVVGWLLEEAEAAPARRIADRMRDEDALVPANWSLEVCNAVRKALRTGRITLDTQVRLQQIIRSLPILAEPTDLERDWMVVLPLAQRLELSTYDAAYLEMAMRLGAPLATLDADLGARAASVGVTVIP
jgi:predicted nucleic acid-binding protein